MFNRYLYTKEWRKRNPDKEKCYARKYYQVHKERFKDYYLKNKHKQGEYLNTWNGKNRLRVLLHYSKNKLVCSICGFSDIRALQLDHLNNDGAKERKIIGKGSNISRHIIKNNFPDKYQVLCANCNAIKEMERRKKIFNQIYATHKNRKT
jgi:hypothetical protein